jgi:hypothetical protein
VILEGPPSAKIHHVLKCDTSEPGLEIEIGIVIEGLSRLSDFDRDTDADEQGSSV